MHQILFQFPFFLGNTLNGEDFVQFLFTKSETLDSCRIETKMRQNASNSISISIFSGGNTPGPPPLGALPVCPRSLGRGGRGWEGKRRGRRGKEGEGKFASLPLGG